ncbi:isopentenyl transferase family protein [Agrobacterium larrymoorei]|uniref:Adenylate dimethylallyltransferase n=1 Tax=Agrobacterium larrymoorei TaxID=160699 RepID=A0A4D7E4B1_9HYPH|nr:isopentenyl transferase family protein [Agrobacterium larrymoorei]QCJ01003.1 isopentenyl transferase [Agrobacterium larrymoorei]QYA10339.1 isopentenyl transferase [Agrobacterium larrymoorei]
MDLHLIFGPTSTGKTAFSIGLSEQSSLPVLALDRVQCCPELSTGSGRPTATELRGTTRLYLEERRLKQGVITAKRAHDQLVETVYTHEAEGGLILEGGSISLLKCMAQSNYWNVGHQWHITRFRLGDEDTFLETAKARVEKMLGSSDRPSLLQELVDLWSDPDLRPALMGIDGYRDAVQFAERNKLEVEELLQLSPSKHSELVFGIAQKYLEYARQQEEAFTLLGPSEGFSQGHPFSGC